MKHADFLILIGGRCDRKWRFSKRETAFAGEQKILNGEIFMNFIGGRCDRKWRFSKREQRLQGSKIFNGGDVDENRHFIEGKLVAHYQILNAMLMKIVILWNFEYFSIGAMLLKIVILLMEKWSHMDKIFNRDMLMKIVILWKKLVAHGHISWIWFDRRTMREEMTIFKKRNNIWRGTNVFSCGRCSWKSSFYWRKIDHTWPNFDIKILSSDDKFCVQLNFRV